MTKIVIKGNKMSNNLFEQTILITFVLTNIHMENKHNGRNRSDGWKHGKNSGHLNEQMVVDLYSKMNSNVEVAGTKKVESIMGKKTTPKPDIRANINNRIIKYSLKKSLNGQVHMNKVKLFIDGYERIFGDIPTDAKDGLLYLFAGNQNTMNVLDDVRYIHSDEKVRDTEIRRKTLCIETLKKYNKGIYDNMITWIQDNISNIVEIVFKRGWAKHEEDFADIVWYKNLVDDGQNVDDMFNIDELIKKCNEHKDEVKPGVKNGGTTINLPFGHLQYHQGGLQFHHSYDKIKSMFNI
jgi:hypothetical protein